MLKVVTGAAVLTLLVASTALAGVAYTAHNLSATNAEGEVCLPCHAPHNAAPFGFLWNHSYRPDTAYAKWEGAALGGATLSCLSCHDGQTSVDDYFGGTSRTRGPIRGDHALGLDLTNDHPVGVEYPNSTRYAAKEVVQGGPGVVIGAKSLPLFTQNGKDQVECATCHTPHDNSYGGFLRVPNYDSALCFGCHVSW